MQPGAVLNSKVNKIVEDEVDNASTRLISQGSRTVSDRVIRASDYRGDRSMQSAAIAELSPNYLSRTSKNPPTIFDPQLCDYPHYCGTMVYEKEIELPHTLATLPRPIDSVNGTICSSCVHSLSGSRKRKRTEVVVGIDGEGANIYNVSQRHRTGKLLLTVYLDQITSSCGVLPSSSANTIRNHTSFDISEEDEVETS